MPQTRYALGRSHNAAELLSAEIYSPIICGCLLLHLNSTHSVSPGSLTSSRTRLRKYSIDRIDMAYPLFSVSNLLFLAFPSFQRTSHYLYYTISRSLPLANPGHKHEILIINLYKTHSGGYPCTEENAIEEPIEKILAGPCEKQTPCYGRSCFSCKVSSVSLS